MSSVARCILSGRGALINITHAVGKSGITLARPAPNPACPYEKRFSASPNAHAHELLRRRRNDRGRGRGTGGILN